MPINYDDLISRHQTTEVTHQDTQTILYALGVGMGSTQIDDYELAYLYEGNGLKTLPSMATVLTGSSTIFKNCGWDYSKILHGEQRLQLHQPIPACGTFFIEHRVEKVLDKGPERGAVVLDQLTVSDKETNAVICTMGNTILARGDGGFGGPEGEIPKPHPIPERTPDMHIELGTRTDQALLYRLCGDRNPIHADPELAHKVGFERPILHGRCSYGIACRGVLQAVCHYDHTRIKTFNARFSAPAYPGETFVLDIWQDREIVSFRLRVKERDAIVLNNGKCVLNER